MNDQMHARPGWDDESRLQYLETGKHLGLVETTPEQMEDQMTKRYTKQDCIDALQEAAEELGDSLSWNEYKRGGFSPSPQVIRDRFGEWNAAKEAAGLGVNPPHRTGGNPPTFRTNSSGYEIWGVYDGGDDLTPLVHRLVAVAEYGFDAVCGKVVHHESEIPWDNRPGNLRLMEDTDHAQLHDNQRDKAGRFV